MAGTEADVERHYTSKDPGFDLGEAILAALGEAGKDIDHLTPRDLAPVDQLHSGGAEMTASLARQLDPAPGSGTKVLDIGCGIGGPARYLADKFGCHVTGIDLVAEFCEVAAMLTGRCGLADKAEFLHAGALDMPFEDASFDLVWSQNVSMNIEDKNALYAEIHRVLSPGRVFTCAEVALGAAGPAEGVIYPVPWARDAAISFLVPPEALRASIEAAGLAVEAWENENAALMAWSEKMRAQAKARSGPALLGAHIVFGADTGARVVNSVKNIAQGRTVHIRALARRPE